LIDDNGPAIRRLHGFLQGIAMDGEITEAEVRDLRDWLEDQSYIRDEWPFDNVWELVERIVEDGQVTDDERQEMLEFCQQVTERGADAQNVASDDERRPPGVHREAPAVVQLDQLCQEHPKIAFSGKSFCFTGKAAAGHRKVLADMAANLGGTILDNVRDDLDYLVIGAFSNTKWHFASYGQKVDKAKQNQDRGHPTLIVHETDFVAAARRETWIRRSEQS
jgi:NAD-dependent DNA ligase